MGQVTMDLAELDKIREDLKIANSVILEKEAVIKQKDEEIVKITADKRTVRIVEKIVDSSSVKFDHLSTSNVSNANFVNPDLYELYNNIMRRAKSFGYSKDLAIRISEEIIFLVKKYVNSDNNVFKPKTVSTTEYINFEDVVSELTEKAESKVAVEIDGYKKTIASLQDKITNFQIAEEKAKKTLIESYEERLDDLSTTYKKEYDALEKAFTDLKEDRDTRTLHQQIEDLKKELEVYKNLKWYQRRK